MVRSLRFPARPRTLLQSSNVPADSRNRMPLARVSFHIQKPKPHSSIKNKLNKIHNQFYVYNTIHKIRGRAVAMAILPPPHPEPCPDSVVLAGEEKKKSTLSQVLKGT